MRDRGWGVWGLGLGKGGTGVRWGCLGFLVFSFLVFFFFFLKKSPTGHVVPR
jgi:hypothetical protein